MNKLRPYIITLSLALPGNITAQQIADVFKNTEVSFSIEGQNRLIDTGTFDEYSKHSGLHGELSFATPLRENLELNIMGNIYGNLDIVNCVADLMLSYSKNDLFSLFFGLEYSQYLIEENPDMFSALFVLNLKKGDFNISVTPYQSLFVGGKMDPNLYIMHTTQYNISGGKKIFVKSMSPTNGEKTQVCFGISYSYNNFELKWTQHYEGLWTQLSLTYTLP